MGNFCLCDFFFVTGAEELVISYSVAGLETDTAIESFLIEGFRAGRSERLTDDTLEIDAFLCHDGETALEEVSRAGTKWKPNVARADS